MALVVLLRGINVGGHRRFRPSELAKELAAFGVASIGATGTFVVRKPGTRARFKAALLGKIPYVTHVVICEGRDILRLAAARPPKSSSARDAAVPFVSFLSKKCRCRKSLPCRIPPTGEWVVRVLSCEGRFVLGEYRRSMKTIGCLGQIDELVGSPATTRTWNTIAAIAAALKAV
jgi:uncharacterized protein (DUF1697 family)